jgi:hypothetical protein
MLSDQHYAPISDDFIQTDTFKQIAWNAPNRNQKRKNIIQVIDQNVNYIPINKKWRYQNTSPGSASLHRIRYY